MIRYSSPYGHYRIFGTSQNWLKHGLGTLQWLTTRQLMLDHCELDIIKLNEDTRSSGANIEGVGRGEDRQMKGGSEAGL